MMVHLAKATLHIAPVPLGTEACDAVGGAFRPECREGRCERGALRYFVQTELFVVQRD